MGKRTPSESAKAGLFFRLPPDEMLLLEKSAAAFGLSKSVLLRKLIRASIDAGPAMSADGVVAVMRLTKQVQALGRNFAQVLRAINAGHAVQLADAVPLIVSIQELMQGVDTNAILLTEGYGARLRKLANVRLVEVET
jgi:hypothetical protein